MAGTGSRSDLREGDIGWLLRFNGHHRTEVEFSRGRARIRSPGLRRDLT